MTPLSLATATRSSRSEIRTETPVGITPHVGSAPAAINELVAPKAVWCTVAKLAKSLAVHRQQLWARGRRCRPAAGNYRSSVRFGWLTTCIEPFLEHFEWAGPMFNEQMQRKDGRMHVSDRPGLSFSLSEPALRWTTEAQEFGERA